MSHRPRKDRSDCLAVTIAGLFAIACNGCAETPSRSEDSRSEERSSLPTEVPAQPTATTGASDGTGRTRQISQSPSGRSLIIHADDVGMCQSVNRATIDALEKGGVSSASIMVPCPAFDEFAEYAKAHPQFDYGIHLTLNAEWPSYRWGPVLPKSEVPSLVDRDGFLWRSEQATSSNARADDVERELRAQIDKARQAGVPLSHLDTHMGTLFLREDFLDIYLRLGDEYRLPVLLTRDDGFARQLGFDDRVVAQIRSAADRCEQIGFPVMGKIFMHYTGDSVTSKKRAYLDMIRRLPAGVSEIVVHCGYDDAELRSITRGAYAIRDGDRQVFTDPKVIAEIAIQDVLLTSWRRLSRTSNGTQPAD
ncbi:MAG: polysaccharide deacetylase family protein [Planctomycetaceae bacterium]